MSRRAKAAVHEAGHPGSMVRYARPVELAPDAGVGTLVQRASAEGLEHLRQNVDGFLTAPAPEHVHQMRVALRRLRAADSLADAWNLARWPKDVRRRMRALGPRLAAARDLDVLCGTTWPALLASSDEAVRAALAPLRDALDRQRVAAYERLRLTLAEANEAWLCTLQPTLEAEPIGLRARDVALAVVARRYRALLRRGRHLPRRGERRRHRVRIAARKFRYEAEFLAAALPAVPLDDLARALSRLQSALGTLNDLAVARGTLRDIAADLPGVTRKALRSAWKAHAHAQRAHGMEALRTAWRRVRRMDMRSAA